MVEVHDDGADIPPEEPLQKPDDEKEVMDESAVQNPLSTKQGASFNFVHLKNRQLKNLQSIRFCSATRRKR